MWTPWRRREVNPIELAAQKLVVSLLQQIERNHMEIGKLVSFGKASEEQIESINQKTLTVIKTLHPLFDVGHALIPEGMPVLHDVMDWAQAIYHEVIEPNIK